jgi:4-carboxymuconolactone decarboxylase
MEDKSYDRKKIGQETFQRITGEMGQALLASVAEVAPDLARVTQEFPFGDLVSRPGLPLREREMATVAALTALGYALPQLKLHIHGALNVGVTESEIVEIIMQMAAYAGFPAALNGILVAKEVFADRKRQTLGIPESA